MEMWTVSDNSVNQIEPFGSDAVKRVHVRTSDFKSAGSRAKN
jgi:hypothetical protein